MNREDFLNRMQETLEGEVPNSVIQSNLQYYRAYLTEEMRKGRSEQDILEELGDPRLIARTIMDSQDAAEGHYGQHVYEEAGNVYEETERTYEESDSVRESGVVGRLWMLWSRIWPKLLVAAVIIGVLVVLGSVFTIALTLLMSPVFWTILAAVAIWRIIRH